jgi:hypothetical protein
MNLLLMGLFGFASVQVRAAIPKTLVPSPAKSFITEGAFRGGISGKGYSLLAVKRVYSKNGLAERLIFQIGDKDGKPYSGEVGYFNAELKRLPSVLSIDLAQMITSRVTLENLRALLTTSKLIRDVRMETDTEDYSTNISVSFQRPVKMRVFSLASKSTPPRIVVDIAHSP